MQLVTKAQSGYLRASDTTEFNEYFFDKGTLGGALITISGRYPETGMAMNEVSDELAYIISGTGSLSTENSTAVFKTGDSLYLPHDEKFYWEGNFTMYVVTSPPFDPKQHMMTP